MRLLDSLFARLFGIFAAAILLGHLIGFFWFLSYGPPPPPPPPQTGFQGPPPDSWHLAGPWVPLLVQIVLMLIAAWFAASLLTRSIRRLGAAAERLSNDLDSAQLPEQGTRELRQAARSFNRMQARVREQVAQRSRMLSALSHDLRTPLARLRLRIEQVGDDTLRDRLAHDLAEMGDLVGATLTYLRQQHNDEPQQVLDLQALLESMAENARDMGDNVDCIGSCQPLRTRPQALRSCLNNLLENALRYAGHASLQIQDTSRWVELRVVDQGPGIPADQREAVFEPFFRLEHSRNRDSGGSGLGLSIAREASYRLGAELILEETPGGGLTARLLLPRV